MNAELILDFCHHNPNKRPSIHSFFSVHIPCSFTMALDVESIVNSPTLQYFLLALGVQDKVSIPGVTTRSSIIRDAIWILSLGVYTDGFGIGLGAKPRPHRGLP